VAKDSSNSSTPWLSPVPDAPEDGDDLGIESDRSSAGAEFSDDHASSGFTAPIVVLIHTCKRELSPAHLVCPWRHNA
jgi:hypothetical protein